MPKIVDHDERRQEFVAALWRIVEHHGCAAVSIRSVADEAGVSKSNIAYYFPTMVDLLAAAVDEVVAHAQSRAAQLDQQDLDIDKATKLVMLAIPDTPMRRRQAQVWIKLVTEYDGDTHVSTLLNDFNKRVRAGLLAMLKLFDASGLVSKDRKLNIEAVRLHALVDGLSLQTMNDAKFMPPSLIRSVVAQHLTELAHPAG
jgi:DNA-binding transcriptional regulator YbjK